MNQEQMDLRFKHRRRIAFAAFVVFVVTGTLTLAFGLYSDAAMNRVKELMPLVYLLTGLYNSLVVGYYVSASWEQGKMTPDQQKS